MYKKRKTFILINAVVSVCWWLLGPLGGCHGCYTSNALTIISAISNENSFLNIYRMPKHWRSFEFTRILSEFRKFI